MGIETTCPHCGGPAEHIRESVEWPIVDAVGNPYGMHRMPTTRYRYTAADPAQVQAMRELLREMYASWLRLVGPDDQKQWRDWKARVIPLLEGVP